MGRKVELLQLLRQRVNKLRKIEYHVKNRSLKDEEMESLIGFLEEILSENLLDIILMDILEETKIQDWPMVKLQKLARKLRIKYWSTYSKEELIQQIEFHETDVMLYFPNFVDLSMGRNEDGKRSTRTDEKTEGSTRRRYKSRVEEIRSKVSRPFEHGRTSGSIQGLQSSKESTT